MVLIHDRNPVNDAAAVDNSLIDPVDGLLGAFEYTEPRPRMSAPEPPRQIGQDGQVGAAHTADAQLAGDLGPRHAGRGLELLDGARRGTGVLDEDTADGVSVVADLPRSRRR
jgi:hypothetical protein